jgi:hypothetical protein
VVHPVTQDLKDVMENSAWPAGFFQTTSGAFQDEPLERGDQGEYETRESVK